MKRGNFGDERYEKKGFQEKVAQVFDTIDGDIWHTIDADKDIGALQAELRQLAVQIIKDSKGEPIGRLGID